MIAVGLLLGLIDQVLIGELGSVGNPLWLLAIALLMASWGCLNGLFLTIDMLLLDKQRQKVPWYLWLSVLMFFAWNVVGYLFNFIWRQPPDGALNLACGIASACLPVSKLLRSILPPVLRGGGKA